MDYLVAVFAVGALASWISIAVGVWVALAAGSAGARLPRTRLYSALDAFEERERYPVRQRVSARDWPPFSRHGGSGAEL